MIFNVPPRWTSDFSEAPSGVRLKNINAGVSELADETDSKSVIRKGVWVRVPPPAFQNIHLTIKSYELYRSPLHPEADSFFIRATPVPGSNIH